MIRNLIRKLFKKSDQKRDLQTGKDKAHNMQLFSSLEALKYTVDQTSMVLGVKDIAVLHFLVSILLDLNRRFSSDSRHPITSEYVRRVMASQELLEKQDLIVEAKYLIKKGGRKDIKLRL